MLSLRLRLRPRLIPTFSGATAIPAITMERGLLMLSQKPRLTPISSATATATPMVDMSMVRGLLMLSLSPRLTLTTSMATDTQLTDMSTESNHQEPKFAYVYIGY